MARVNVEEQAFGDTRLERAARLIRKSGKWDVDELSHRAALGCMCFLWHESQAAGVSVATASQIDRWCGLDGISDVLEEAGYLQKCDEGYRISGNEKQIESMAQWMSQKQAAGKASAEKRRLNGRSRVVQRSFNGRSTVVNDPPTKVNERQHNTVSDPIQEQFKIGDPEISEKEFENPQLPTQLTPFVEPCVPAEPPSALAPVALQDPLKKKSGRPRSEKPGTDGSKVWAAYSDAMAGFGRKPTRGAHENAICAKLVEAEGVENACLIVKHFVTRKDFWYLKHGHKISLALENRVALLAEVQSKFKLTPEVMKRITKAEETENQTKLAEMGLAPLSFDEIFGIDEDDGYRRLCERQQGILP